jgi:hypothetical protein
MRIVPIDRPALITLAVALEDAGVIGRCEFTHPGSRWRGDRL